MFIFNILESFISFTDFFYIQTAKIINLEKFLTLLALVTLVFLLNVILFLCFYINQQTGPLTLSHTDYLVTKETLQSWEEKIKPPQLRFNKFEIIILVFIGVVFYYWLIMVLLQLLFGVRIDELGIFKIGLIERYFYDPYSNYFN